MAKKSVAKTAIFVAILLVAFLPPFIKYQQINYKSRALDRQLKSIKEEIGRLEEEKRRLETDIIYVEKRARDKIGVAKKGEIILKSYPTKTPPR
jgi:cell division protein FtsB